MPKIVVAVLLAFCCTFNYAQDKIYFANKVIEGRLTEVGKDWLKYIDENKAAKEQIVTRSNALFAFNSYGEYLVLAKLNETQPDAAALINQFINGPKNNNRTYDVIINKKRNKLNANIVNLYDSAIAITIKNQPLTLATKTLAAIIFRNGEHAIFDDFQAAAAMLWLYQKDFLTIQTTANTAPKTQTANGNELTKTGKKVLPTAANRDAKYSSVLYDEGAKPTIETGNKQPYKSLAGKKTYNDLSGGVPFPEFEKKAIEKVQILSDYIKILCDKKTDYYESNKAIEGALELFVDENVVVEVSSSGKLTKTRLKIRDYLTKLKLVKYEKVEIEWTNIQYVSNFKKGPDGNYYGEVSFEQVFRGYKDGKLVYSDVTQKTAQVVLKSMNKQIEGKKFLVWDVLLSDIGVTVTK
ncbi:MAG: hypothetical protein ACOVNR_03065 [Chitinophagaceae bacterium]